MPPSIYFSYDKKGRAVPDHEAEQWILDSYKLKQWGSADTCFSTENIVWAARYLFATHQIPYLDIKGITEAWGNDWSPIQQWKNKKEAAETKLSDITLDYDISIGWTPP